MKKLTEFFKRLSEALTDKCSICGGEIVAWNNKKTYCTGCDREF